MTGELDGLYSDNCAFCLNMKGHVCYECCEDRHKLVKRELDELKDQIQKVIKVLALNNV